MHQVIHDIRKAIKQTQPLIHCITNPISINQCANAILAIGARPIMAEHPLEVQEITETAAADGLPAISPQAKQRVNKHKEADFFGSLLLLWDEPHALDTWFKKPMAASKKMQ